MKLVDRETFLTLPAGTVYFEHKSVVDEKTGWVHQSTSSFFSVKMSHLAERNDWGELPLMPLYVIRRDYHGKPDWKDWESELLDTPGGYAALSTDSWGQNGMYDGDEVKFVVLDKADVTTLRDLFNDCLAKLDAAEVIPFPGPTYGDVSSSKVLTGAVGKVERAIVVGVDDEEGLYLAAADGDVDRNVGLLMRAVAFLTAETKP